MTVYRFGDKNKKLYITRESVWESIISDVFMTLCNIFVLYLSYKYFGNEWLPCMLLFLIFLGLQLRANEKVISKKEFIKMIEEEISND